MILKGKAEGTDIYWVTAMCQIQDKVLCIFKLIRDSQQRCEIGMISLILKPSRLRLGEVKYLDQDHTARKQ